MTRNTSIWACNKIILNFKVASPIALFNNPSRYSLAIATTTNIILLKSLTSYCYKWLWKKKCLHNCTLKLCGVWLGLAFFGTLSTQRFQQQLPSCTPSLCPLLLLKKPQPHYFMYVCALFCGIFFFLILLEANERKLFFIRKSFLCVAYCVHVRQVSKK